MTQQDTVYHRLVRHIVDNGQPRIVRNGHRVISVFGYSYHLDLSEGFPLLTTKKVSFRNIVMENLWFLTGQSDVRWLQKRGCNIWNEWADKRGHIRHGYGEMWRGKDHTSSGRKAGTRFDQIKHAISILQQDPFSRRNVVSAWPVGYASEASLPACHTMFVLNVDLAPDGGRRLNLHLTQRSCDVGIGLPYNMAGYGFLMHVLARIADMKVGVFSHAIVDAHIYEGGKHDVRHRRSLLRQIERPYRMACRFEMSPKIKHLGHIEALAKKDANHIMEHFAVHGYNPHKPVKLRIAE